MSNYKQDVERAFSEKLTEALAGRGEKLARAGELLSPALREALRTDGWWKLAAQVKRAQGLAAPDEPTLPNFVQALSMKIAADSANRRQIRAGLDAYARLKGST